MTITRKRATAKRSAFQSAVFGATVTVAAAVVLLRFDPRIGRYLDLGLVIWCGIFVALLSAGVGYVVSYTNEQSYLLAPAWLRALTAAMIFGIFSSLIYAAAAETTDPAASIMS
ncbi:hypothetical protein HJC99_05620 [Candidatus Saccharibacteria bacterium]|nr:hypothetical protein [Candidatus Saccharibacteria bacterium]